MGGIGEGAPSHRDTTIAVVGSWAPLDGERDQLHVGNVLVMRCPAPLRSFQKAMRSTPPTWLLIGWGMSDQATMEYVQAGRVRSPELRLAMFGSDADTMHQQRWLLRGCEAYLSQRLTAKQVVEILMTVARFNIVVIDRRLKRVIRTTLPDMNVQLTPRENDVITLLCQGLRNAEISTKLHLTVNTVEFHLRNIFTKLGVETRVEAVRRAVELGVA